MGNPWNGGVTGISRRKETGGSAPAAVPGTAGALGMILAALPKSQPSVRSVRPSVRPQTTTPCVPPTFQRWNFPRIPSGAAQKCGSSLPRPSHSGNPRSLGRAGRIPGMGKGRRSRVQLRNFPHLFLPTVSWSLTTTVSSASGSRGIPFRSHSNPWRKRGGRGRDQCLEMRNPNAKPPRNHSIPKAKLPSKSTRKSWEKVFPGHGLPGRSKSQELLQSQICACFPTKFPFFF